MGEVRAKKALGQHFLTDLNIARKIATSLSGGTSDSPDKVLEVGCGMGVLTQFLLEREDIVTYGAEPEDGMYIIDQHAAAERINYEKVLKSLKEQLVIVDMLVPIKIELASNEFLIVKERLIVV